MAGSYRLVGCLGRQAGIVVIYFDKGMELRLIRVDLFEYGFNQLNRRKLPSGDHVGENMRRQRGEI